MDGCDAMATNPNKQKGHPMKHAFHKLALVAALVTAGSTAMAQSAGTWMVKGGVNNIDPHVTSGDLSPPSLPGRASTVCFRPPPTRRSDAAAPRR